MELPQTGGCQCGKVRYEISEEPVSVYICHCLDCQRLTGSAFSLGIASAVSGTLKLTWLKPREPESFLGHNARAVVNGPVPSGRLSLEDFIAFGELDPRLLPVNPYVPRRSQPGCIVQRTAPDPDCTFPRDPANPRAAFRAN